MSKINDYVTDHALLFYFILSLFFTIKEPTTNDDYSSDSTLSNSKSNNQRSLTSTPMPQIAEPSTQPITTNASSSTSSTVQNSSSGVSNSTESVTPTSSLASMIKVGYARKSEREKLGERTCS